MRRTSGKVRKVVELLSPEGQVLLCGATSAQIFDGQEDRRITGVGGRNETGAEPVYCLAPGFPS